MRRATLPLALLMVAALAQGCFVGRSLYYDQDAVTDELSSTSSVTEGDGGVAKGGEPGDASSTINGPGAPLPPTPPPPAGDGGDTETCSAIGVACANGGAMEYCVVYKANACSQLIYKHGGKSFACSCGAVGNDCTNAYYGAYTSCQDAAGSCVQLGNCCNAAEPAYQESCRETLKQYAGQAYGDVACKSVVASYRSSKICP